MVKKKKKKALAQTHQLFLLKPFPDSFSQREDSRGHDGIFSEASKRKGKAHVCGVGDKGLKTISYLLTHDFRNSWDSLGSTGKALTYAKNCF